ncbi:hypothetical protein PB1_16239 [Bacillus methanolicus PB1]|uniref:Uncharacterized protein n=1 Tax=Bacillus methanolicus PB1 TaxID=997296 RepID=I3DY02_BACMT|nr:hypothetical protein PB1_16239 [Bacillus methanolicus PB1]
MIRIKWEIKYFLSGIQFYRKIKGGHWYKVRPKYDLMYGSYWINRAPFFNEIVIATEVY